MGKIKQEASSLDSNETYWSLGCILGFLGIPGMIIGNQLAKTYGITFSILSIITGNLILWAFGLGIVSMAQGKSHAIDNVKKHLGKTSSILAILLFTLAFLMWYTLQLSSAVSRTCQVFQFHEKWKVGLILGIVVALFSSGGFKMIKRACLIGLPILVGITIYYIANNKESIQYAENPHFSFFAILPIIMAWLAGTVNFPTFFRHARSKAHSIIALALVMLFHIFFQVSTIFYGIDVLSMNIIDAKQTNTILNLILSTSFSLISFTCMNLINIYFTSACLEKIFPKAHGNTKYVICAVIGTVTYIYLQITNKTEGILLVETAITYSMAMLVLSLLIHFLISIAVKHRVRYLSHFISSVSWIIGCVKTIESLIQTPEEPTQALIAGVVAIILFSIATIFIEETIWSAKVILERKKA